MSKIIFVPLKKLAVICKPIGLQEIGNIVGFLHDNSLLTRTRNLLNASSLRFDYDHIGI